MTASGEGTKQIKAYRGIVRVNEGRVTLEAGGIEIRIEGDPEKFAPINGLFTTVNGVQEGDTIRNAAPALQPEAAAAEASGAELFEPIIAAIRAHETALREIPGVFGVRPGFRTLDGELTQEPAIIVVTKPDEEVGPLPPDVAGIYVEKRTASALEMVEGLAPLSVWEGVVPEAVPQIAYTPPDPPLALAEARVHNITCHVGPDSGWTTLKPFLDGTTTSLTVAMYEFYAEHVIDTVTQLGEEESEARLNMILQVSSNDDEIEGDSWQ